MTAESFLPTMDADVIGNTVTASGGWHVSS